MGAGLGSNITVRSVLGELENLVVNVLGDRGGTSRPDVGVLRLFVDGVKTT